MKKTCYFIIISSVLAIVSGYVYSQWDSYHDFKGRCLDCHLTVPGEGGQATVFVKDMTRMCRDCHKESVELSHPVDVRPTMEVPAKFPLDWKGDITCVTCHPVHDEGFGGFHLRSRTVGQGFCINCHSDLDEDMHKVSLGTAHVSRSTASLNEIPAEMEVTLDELSLKCMACHDATFASDALAENMALKVELFHDSASIGVSHPIGVSYAEAKRKYFGAYRDIDKLPPEIKLFGGLVGCGTCHNPYSKRHYELVMSNKGSALCFACHMK